ADGPRYVLGREQARGGLGRILAAWDRYMKREVALKQLLVPTETGRARLQREALLTARLEHPAIIPVYDHGLLPDGAPFYAMKLVQGRSLRDEIAARPTLAERMALLPNVLAVADGMAYAHERGIVHRDLKPANVLL